MQQQNSKRYMILYAAIQGTYWMGICAAISYASVYLLDKGYTNSQIGILMAVSNVLAVILQPLIASFADSHPRIALNHITALLSTILTLSAAILIMVVTKSVVLTIIMTFVATLIMTIQPLMNALSTVYEKEGVYINFGLARGAGSLSYAILSTCIGYLLKVHTVIIIPVILTIITAAFTVLTVVFRMKYKETKTSVHNETQAKSEQAKDLLTQPENEEKASSLFEFIKTNKRFMVFLGGIFLIFYHHQTLSVFTIQVIESFQGTSTQMGIANSIAAIFEVPAMLLTALFIKKFGCQTMLKVAACVFAVKHFIILGAGSVTAYYVSQVLQFGSYAIFIPASVYYVSHLLSKKDAVKGQAFITTAMTLSTVFASIISGRLLDVTSVHHVIEAGTVIALIGSAVMFCSVEQFKTNKYGEERQ